MNDQTRREFLKTATLGTVGLAGGLACRGSGKRKPNLLFIWTDEQRADTLAAYGNHRIQAPNLNKLAAESVVFQRAYVTQPVCTPARSSVMTGLWPHTTGCTANNIPLPPEIPCFPELLGDPDYRTAYMGKWHLGDEVFPQHGFEEWVSIDDGYTDHYSPYRDRTARSSYHHYLLDQGYHPDSGGKFSRGFAASRPLEHCKPAFLERQACDFLQRQQDNPFILHINFLEPHMPFTGPLNDLHDPDEVDLPANFHDPLEENEPLRYRLIREYARDKYGESEEAIRELIARYWGLVAQVDRSVGIILGTLEELDLADNTIVVYTSDHGDMMGSHGMVEKQVMYEESVRVPWLLRVPGLGHRMVTQPVSHIDLAPTLLDLMSHAIPGNLPGQSLTPLMRGESVAEDHVFIEWNPNVFKVMPGSTMASRAEMDRVAGEHTRTVVSPDGWKLCLSDADRSQLFNLNDDPGETTNLFDSGRHTDVIQRLTRRIQDWQRQTGDKKINLSG